MLKNFTISRKNGKKSEVLKISRKKCINNLKFLKCPEKILSTDKKSVGAEESRNFKGKKLEWQKKKSEVPKISRQNFSVSGKISDVQKKKYTGLKKINIADL